MQNTKADKHVLIATDYENMFEVLNENNTVLDEIKKSLNDYLEKKRLFFPRYVMDVCTLLFGSVLFNVMQELKYQFLFCS